MYLLSDINLLIFLLANFAFDFFLSTTLIHFDVLLRLSEIVFLLFKVIKHYSFKIERVEECSFSEWWYILRVDRSYLECALS